MLDALASHIVSTLFNLVISQIVANIDIISVSNYPDLHFVIIINPNSGPGVDPAGWLPDKHYSREIPRLTERANVTVVGYVRVDYCRRPLKEVLEDIRKYANWSNGIASHSNDTDDSVALRPVMNNHFAVRGIFFDEVPNIWGSEEAAYLEDAGVLVKKIEGILGDRLVSSKSLCKLSLYRPKADRIYRFSTILEQFLIRNFRSIGVACSRIERVLNVLVLCLRQGRKTVHLHTAHLEPKDRFLGAQMLLSCSKNPLLFGTRQLRKLD